MIKIFNYQIFTLLLLLSGSLLFAQTEQSQFKSFQVEKNELVIELNTGIYRIKPFGEKTMQTRFIPIEGEKKYESFGVSKKEKHLDYELNENEQFITYKTKGISIKIYKLPFKIEYFYKDELLISESEICTVTDTLSKFQFELTDTEKLFGGGSRVLGMNRRGYKLPLYNRAHYGFETHSEQMNYSVPIVISSKKYAILFDNPAKGFLDLDSKKNNKLIFESVSGAMNYYITVGNDWYDLVSELTLLTGRQPLPPLWAFGNFSSRFGYHSQKEVLNTAQLFVKQNITVEAIILDIYWFGKEIMSTMGTLDWYRDSFPNPETMISDLKKQNIRTILVTEPFILTTSSRWKEATDNKVLGKKTNGEPYTYDFYFGNTGLIDVFETKSRNWFWNIYKDLATQGISGWWGDLGEPEVHPSDLIHSVGTADQVHNAYGHCWAQMIYEGYERDFPNERPFILMRSGFAGTQRYGIIPWTGDVARSWGGLYSQPEISLQMGMQGIAYMHSDLGGFAGGEQIDNELYIRWLQYGVFQPIFRPHAQESIAPEPVFQNDTTKQHAINAINLRYKLLPYVYTMAYQNSISGKPLMIPLFFEEENNIELLDYQDAYLWGDAFLVSPVKAPNLKTQDVYFPKNSEWFDFYTEKSYVGGKTSTIKLSIDYIPAFVRGGTFLPMLKEAKNTELYSLSQFEMHYFLSQTNSESEYKLFNDDGKTPKTYEKSLYELIEFSAKNKSNSLKIDIEYIEKLYSTKNKEITFVIHNATQKPKSISVKNEKVEWSYNEELKKIEFTINFYENKEIVIKF